MSSQPISIPAKSVAVLAFADLSPKHDQVYFSDGMSDEIRNALAQIQDMKVAGRDSSFYFKNKDDDLRLIGKTLGVANVLEGSVRKQGNEVRITVQLVRIADDTQLWSHAYDGNLSDVFKLQEDIARAVTDRLKVVLDASQQTQLVNVGTTNTAAYTLYLKARDVESRHEYTRMGEAIGWLEQAIKLDPGFARAHALESEIYAIAPGWIGSGIDFDFTEGERQARLALALDPSLAEPHLALADIAQEQWRFLDARAEADRALALEPDDASVNLIDAQLLITTGYRRQGVARLDRALEIDPLLPNALFWRAWQYQDAGDLDAAERLYQQAAKLGLTYADWGLERVAEARGDHQKAIALASSNYDVCLKSPASAHVFYEGVYGGDAQARARALALANECAARPDVPHYLAVVGFLRLGQPQRALDVIAQQKINDDSPLMDLWGPVGQSARRLPAFAAFARKIGFAALWDKYGPPDLCRKNAAGDYVCQ